MIRNHLVGILAIPLFFYSAGGTSFAAKLKNGPKSDPALVGLQGVLATAAPNLEPLAEGIIKEHSQLFKLKDGTQVSGLYFKGESQGMKPLPLFMINFGLFTDAYLPPISYFIKDIVLTHKLKADVLVVESVTSADFFAKNKESGLGGYDEGRILCELSQQFEILQTRPIYLMGVSLGGNGVIQALIEDERLKTHHFSGAITFSAVLDEAESSQALVTSFGEPLAELEPAQIGAGGKLVVKIVLKQMIQGLKRNGLDTSEVEGSASDFFLRTFALRLKHLSKFTSDPTWNPAVSTASAAAYFRSSSALLDKVDSIKVPLLVIHAKNDPLVPYSQFRDFEEKYIDQNNIRTHSTRFGGHWGFLSTYGGDWVLKLIQIMQAGDSWDLP